MFIFVLIYKNAMHCYFRISKLLGNNSKQNNCAVQTRTKKKEKKETMAPTSNAERCRKYREKNKENYRKNDALCKKHCRLLLKLKDKGKYNLQKEKEKLRKRAEREKKKISSEPIPPATPTAASTLEPSLAHQVLAVHSNIAAPSKDT